MQLFKAVDCLAPLFRVESSDSCCKTLDGKRFWGLLTRTAQYLDHADWVRSPFEQECTQGPGDKARDSRQRFFRREDARMKLSVEELDARHRIGNIAEQCCNVASRTSDRRENNLSRMQPDPRRKSAVRMTFIEFLDSRRDVQRGPNGLALSFRRAGVRLPGAQRTVARDIRNNAVVAANRGEKRFEIVAHQIVQTRKGQLFGNGGE